METTQHDFESNLERSSLPYPTEAYEFVREGLGYTESRLEAERNQLGTAPRHMKGQELCIGLRDFAIERWGLMAPAVLRHWQIHRTEDFGRIVFVLVNEGTLSKTDDDSLADFRGVYDLVEALGQSGLQVGFQDG
jgi:uncharacterized repeat protein (TIGR04138 family)